MAPQTHSWNTPAADRVLLPAEETQTDEKQKFCDLGTCPKKEDLRLEWLGQEVGAILQLQLVLLSRGQGQMCTGQSHTDKGVAVQNMAVFVV